MPFKITPLTLSDIDTILTLKYSTQGHLSAAAVDVAWPITDDASADRRHAWSLGQQASFFGDPTAHLLQVVDDSPTSEAAVESTLTLARWHKYTSPPFYSDREFTGDAPRDKQSYPEGVHAELYDVMLDKVFVERSRWMTPGPRWVLTNLKTRETVRRRGAGSAAVKWGVGKARADGCPAYLEASADAVSLYKECGFEEVGELAIDLSKFGAPASVIIKLMAANVRR